MLQTPSSPLVMSGEPCTKSPESLTLVASGARTWNVTVLSGLTSWVAAGGAGAPLPPRPPRPAGSGAPCANANELKTRHCAANAAAAVKYDFRFITFSLLTHQYRCPFG